MAHTVPPQAIRDVHRAITEKIVAAIALGNSTHECPWHRMGGSIGRPMNACIGNKHHGVNVLSLWVDALTKEIPTGYWASYQQWQTLGAQVRRGERGSLIVFYRKLDRGDEDEKDRPRYVSRGSTVFNVAQVQGTHPRGPARHSGI